MTPLSINPQTGIILRAYPTSHPLVAPVHPTFKRNVGGTLLFLQPPLLPSMVRTWSSSSNHLLFCIPVLLTFPFVCLQPILLIVHLLKISQMSLKIKPAFLSTTLPYPRVLFWSQNLISLILILL